MLEACNTVFNMTVEEFMEGLNNLTTEQINEHERVKKIYGLPLHSSNKILRDNMIYNYVASNIREKSAFDLKLDQLAMTFSDNDYFNSLAIGNPRTGDLPLNDARIASIYDTTEDNVIMYKLFKDFSKKYKVQTNKQLIK